MVKHYGWWGFRITTDVAEKFINTLLEDAADKVNTEEARGSGEAFIPEEYVRCSLRLGEGVGTKMRYYPLVLLLPAVFAVDGVDTDTKQGNIKKYISEAISPFLYKEEGSNEPLLNVFKDIDFQKTGTVDKKIEAFSSIIVPRIVEAGDDLNKKLGINYPPIGGKKSLNIEVIIDPLRLFSKMLSSSKYERPRVMIDYLKRWDSNDFTFIVLRRM